MRAKTNVGRNLKLLRTSLGLSAAKLSAEAKVPKGHIYNVESGLIQTIMINLLDTLRNKYNVDLNLLFGEIRNIFINKSKKEK